MPDYDIVADRDYFFIITDSEVVETQATVIENLMENVPMLLLQGKSVTYHGNITVYNLNGQAVLTGRQAVDMSGLQRGIYIVQGRDAGNVQTIKVNIGR